MGAPPADVDDSSPVPAVGIERLRAVLERSPASAVGLFDRAVNLIDPVPLLAQLGLPTDVTVLHGRALVEIVSIADAPLVSITAAEARANGHGVSTVRLRDGASADLHIIGLGSSYTTIAVLEPTERVEEDDHAIPTSMEASPLAAHLRCDAFGVVVGAGPSSIALLGRSESELIGMVALALIPEEQHGTAVANWIEAKESRGVSLRWRTPVLRPDGTSFWSDITLTNDIDESGEGDVNLDIFDVSREVDATEALAAERELLSAIAELLPVGVAKFDAAGGIHYANAQLGELLAPDVPEDIIRRAVAGSIDDVLLSTTFADLLSTGAPTRTLIEHRAGRTVRHLEWSVRAVLDGSGQPAGGVVCVADVSEAVALRRALEQRAITDPLTDCFNRAGTLLLLDEQLERTREPVTVLFIDLDGFKQINDERGHAVGDAVLVAVAARLRASVRDGDVVGRLGGDEFVVIAPELASDAEADELAQRLASRLGERASILGIDLAVTASIGVARGNGPAASLLAAADAAMYTAKEHSSARHRRAALGAPR